MIYYLVTANHQYTMRGYLRSWGKLLRETIQIIPYEKLATYESLTYGTYIFSDLERLSPEQKSAATEFQTRILEHSGEVRTLNNPSRSLCRYNLLKALEKAGYNDFRTYRFMESLNTQLRFPVFIREENEHSGNLTELLYDQSDIDTSTVQLLLSGFRLKELLAVEYCDTKSKEGIYRKFAAFKIGKNIIPRHVIFSRNWVLKAPDIISKEFMKEEKYFLENNPHEDSLREIFSIANIDYGRIDYSILDGKLQVWEINTNPIVMKFKNNYNQNQIPAQEYFALKVRNAFEAINLENALEGNISLSPDMKGLYRLSIPRQAKRRAMKTLLRIWSSYPSTYKPLGRFMRHALNFDTTMRSRSK